MFTWNKINFLNLENTSVLLGASAGWEWPQFSDTPPVPVGMRWPWLLWHSTMGAKAMTPPAWPLGAAATVPWHFQSPELPRKKSGLPANGPHWGLETPRPGTTTFLPSLPRYWACEGSHRGPSRPPSHQVNTTRSHQSSTWPQRISHWTLPWS